MGIFLFHNRYSIMKDEATLSCFAPQPVPTSIGILLIYPGALQTLLMVNI